MELGPHRDAVLEVVDLVESGAIFRDPRPPLGQLKLIDTMAEVRDYVHASPGVPEDQGWDWWELVESGGEPGTDFVVELHLRRKSVPGLTASLRDLVDRRIFTALERQLGGGYTETDILFIVGNLQSILRCRATFGRSLPFIERLVEIYRLGGHPCGWIGAYPEGQLVAYFPPTKVPRATPGGMATVLPLARVIRDHERRRGRERKRG